ncbi:9337_t:CDS:2, partial [Gigaspora margarita]
MLLKVAEGISKGKETITIGSGCKKASVNMYETEQKEYEKVNKDEFNLAEYGKNEELDIIGIVETNLMEKEASRIDFIWVDEDIGSLIQDAVIEDIEDVTGSDHGLVWCLLEINKILRFSETSKNNKHQQTRKVFLYYKATEENWKGYRSCLNHKLGTKSKKLRHDAGRLEEEVNEEWDIISRAILQATNKNILHIKVKSSERQIRKAIPKLLIYKDTSVLYQMIKYFKIADGRRLEPELQSGASDQGIVQNEVGSRRIKISRRILRDVSNVMGNGSNNTNRLKCLDIIRMEPEKRVLTESREVKNIRKKESCEVVVKSWEVHLIELVVRNAYCRDRLVEQLEENKKLENE